MKRHLEELIKEHNRPKRQKRVLLFAGSLVYPLSNFQRGPVTVKAYQQEPIVVWRDHIKGHSFVHLWQDVPFSMPIEDVSTIIVNESEVKEEVYKALNYDGDAALW